MLFRVAKNILLRMELTPLQVDALSEIINIGVGRAAGVLNQLLDSHVTLRTPEVQVFKAEEITRNITRFGEEKLSTIFMAFAGELSGNASLVFPAMSAANLVTLITREQRDSPELDSLKTGALSEVGNIVLSSVMGAIANSCDLKFKFSIPSYLEDSITNILKGMAPRYGTVVLAKTVFKIEEHEIVGDILILFEVDSLDSILSSLGASGK